MLITSAEITGIIGSYIWPLFRIAAMLMAAPIFSSNFVNTRARLMIALAASIVIVPTIPNPAPAVEVLSGDGMLIVANQILIGASIGLMLQMLFNAFIIGGQIVAMQMGLGFASMVDPQNGMTVPVISQFYLILVTLFFLSLNGHLILIQVIHESFISLPISADGIPINSYRDIVGIASWMYAAAVIISLPAIGSLMLVNLSFGILSRAAPQISPFSIGFPMTIILGFAIMFITLPNVASHLTDMSSYMLDLARRLVHPNG